MIPVDKADQGPWLQGVRLVDQMRDEAYEEDRFMLMAARWDETHDNIVRRYLAQAQQEGDMVLEGFTAALSDLITSNSLLDRYLPEAMKAAYWAQHPERARAEFEGGSA